MGKIRQELLEKSDKVCTITKTMKDRLRIINALREGGYEFGDTLLKGIDTEKDFRDYPVLGVEHKDVSGGYGFQLLKDDNYYVNRVSNDKFLRLLGIVMYDIYGRKILTKQMKRLL